MPDLKAVSALVGLLAEAPRQRLIVVICLMIVIALSEGVGIMMLVPLLTLVGNTGETSSKLADTISGLGFSDNLAAMLCLFVALIALRSLLQYMLQRTRSGLEFYLIDRLRESSFEGLLRAEWRWVAQERASDFSALLITNVPRQHSIDRLAA